MRAATPLTAGWTLRLERTDGPAGLPVGTTVPATVPGCVHTDLLAAGLIGDPYVGTCEAELAWIGRADWRYSVALPARDPVAERAELVFDGLDTVARVSLDGTVLGETRNMHRGYRFDVTGLAGGVVESLFTSAYAEAERVRAALGERPNSYPEPFQYLRKMACNFGWDWGPTLVTAGVWRPARLEQWSVARLDRVHPLVTVSGRQGRVDVPVSVRRSRSGADRALTAELAIHGPGGTAAAASVVLGPGRDAATLAAGVPDPALWWPHSLGAQPLYECMVTLRDAGTGEVLDTWARRIGFRTVEVDTRADGEGTAFTFVVNGVPIFARGVNWIPDDAFPSRIDAARYRTRLRQARDAHVDLVRVWGGGIYESDDFYDACDELGLLVWQDFLFACAAYPEEPPLRGEVEAEARENVARLAHHPSLALWNGNNENLWGFRDWGWEPELSGASWGEGYYLGLLPRVVAEVDPTRAYWAGSPWSGSWRRHPNDPDHGTTHLWEEWNRRDYAGYLGVVPRFVAEFGWQAPPAWETLRSVVPDADLRLDSPAMLAHQKAGDGFAKLARGLADHFGAPESLEHWHYLTQVVQARAVATGIEHWRAHWPRCAGSVAWQLNDCWPVISWSAIDGAGRAKPLYHELRRVYADRLLTFTGGAAVAVVNQAARPWAGAVTVRRLRVDGSELAAAILTFDVPARAVATLTLPPELAAVHDGGKEFLLAEAGAGTLLRAWRFATPDRDFAYPEARMGVTTAPGAGGTTVTVTAHTLLRDLLLQADRLAPGAVADRGLVTLLPGESVDIRVAGWSGGAGEIAAARALWCVNGGASR